MMFYSTNDKSHRVDARTAVLAGLAPDGGLYMPETIPQLPAAFFDGLADASLHEIGLTVARAFFGDVVEDGALKQIVEDAIDFEIPLQTLPKDSPPARGGARGGGSEGVAALHVLELFHGPTLAFKDVGARFMARLMGYFIASNNEKITILVATSGDTGSAVASGFYNVPGVNVVILYPSRKVSALQEAQMTTLGGNVTALEIDGVFDDCQRLVKQAFVDEELTSRLQLTSANSINIARLIPQTFYYFWAVAQLMNSSPLLEYPPPARPVHRSFSEGGSLGEGGGGARGGGRGGVIVSVPSGNFGNLTAGLIAKRMGLQVNKFIAATNVNDVVPEYLETTVFRPRASIQTMSNAMDVGNPSNFSRMLELYPTVEAMREDVVGIRVSEEKTRETIAAVRRDHHYQLDPHGAVAYAALQKYCASLRLPAIAIATAGESAKQSLSGIFFETAHPAKFLDVEIPSSLAECLSKSKQSIPITATLDALRSVLE